MRPRRVVTNGDWKKIRPGQQFQVETMTEVFKGEAILDYFGAVQFRPSFGERRLLVRKSEVRTLFYLDPLAKKASD